MPSVPNLPRSQHRPGRALHRARCRASGGAADQPHHGRPADRRPHLRQTTCGLDLAPKLIRPADAFGLLAARADHHVAPARRASSWLRPRRRQRPAALSAGPAAAPPKTPAVGPPARLHADSVAPRSSAERSRRSSARPIDCAVKGCARARTPRSPAMARRWATGSSSTRLESTARPDAGHRLDQRPADRVDRERIGCPRSAAAHLLPSA